MPYVIRRSDSEEYLNDAGRFGPLHEAYVYCKLQNAQAEVANPETEEVVEITLTVRCIVPRAPEPPTP